MTGTVKTSEVSQVTALATMIASWPAHYRDLGPDNEVIGDRVSLDPGQEAGEVPALLVRLAGEILGTLLATEPVAWRRRLKGAGGTWSMTDDPADAKFYAASGRYDTQALVPLSSPPPSTKGRES